MQTGIYPNIHEDDYHSGNEISKSGLWTIYKRTPFHYRYGDKKESNSMKFGKAAHTAVLEPEFFEKRFFSGPEDRRGNKWKDALVNAENFKQEVLTAGEYADCLRLRDALMKNPLVLKAVTGKSLVENSAYYVDEKTNQECRIRPDLVNPELKIIIDLKSTTDASPWAWQKRVADYGFHLQESMYTHGWQQAGGCPIDAFVFLTIEQEAPFAHAIYELEPVAANEGWLIYEKAMETYAACKDNDNWPSYGEGVISLNIPKFAFQLTPEGERQ